MKKNFFFLAALVLGAMAASVNAQTLSSSTVDVRYCFTTYGEETASDLCSNSYVWEGGAKGDTTITASGDYVRTLINARGCDSIVTLHLTLENHHTSSLPKDTTICLGKPLVFNNETIAVSPTTGTYVAYSRNDYDCEHTDTLKVTVNPCYPQGAASGHYFSIAADKQVYFSKGNLVFTTGGTRTCSDGSTKNGTFSFADNQYDEGSKFTNGSSGVSSSYSPAGTSAGYSTAVAGTNYDWGVYNPITNGGNQPNMWRTLTGEEWTYILDRKDANDNNKYGVATIATNNYGFIILPDDWTLPEGLSFTPYDSGADKNARTASKKPSANKYSKNDWAEMEKAGAVFLFQTLKDNTWSKSYWNASAKTVSMSYTSGDRTYSIGANTTPASGMKQLSAVRLVSDL